MIRFQKRDSSIYIAESEGICENFIKQQNFDKNFESFYNFRPINLIDPQNIKNLL